MVSDSSEGIAFVCNNIVEYGGDPDRIYLMGQSAGAHIAACALVEQAIKEMNGEKISWSLSQIKAYFGLSGGFVLIALSTFRSSFKSNQWAISFFFLRYNLYNLVDHFHNRGLYRSIFLRYLIFFCCWLYDFRLQLDLELLAGSSLTNLVAALWKAKNHSNGSPQK